MNDQPSRSDGRRQPARPVRTRSTRQKRAIEEVLSSCEDFQTAQEIHDLLRDEGESVGLATVYRTLQALSDAGDLDVVSGPGGEAAYRRCRSPRHHHHLVCRQCGRTVEIEGPTVERWAATMARQHDFADVEHTVELFGTCPTCQPASDSA